MTCASISQEEMGKKYSSFCKEHLHWYFTNAKQKPDLDHYITECNMFLSFVETHFGFTFQRNYIVRLCRQSTGSGFNGRGLPLHVSFCSCVYKVISYLKKRKKNCGCSFFHKFTSSSSFLFWFLRPVEFLVCQNEKLPPAPYSYWRDGAGGGVSSPFFLLSLASFTKESLIDRLHDCFKSVHKFIISKSL